MQVNFTGDREVETKGEDMVRDLQANGHEVDRKLEQSSIQWYKSSAPVLGFESKADLVKQNGWDSDGQHSTDPESSDEGDFLIKIPVT